MCPGSKLQHIGPLELTLWTRARAPCSVLLGPLEPRELHPAPLLYYDSVTFLNELLPGGLPCKVPLQHTTIEGFFCNANEVARSLLEFSQ